MTSRAVKISLCFGILGSWLTGFGGCSTSEVSPIAAPPASQPPAYVQAPHPVGYDIGDIQSIFTTNGAPTLLSLKDCDAGFSKLKDLSKSEEEFKEGTLELVRSKPLDYHWCFYGKILELEQDLKKELFYDDRQKRVLSTYAFLTPIARAFMSEYHDSRYLRWAVRHYRGLSEWVFYRRLELTPQATSDLVEATNPFGWMRPSEDKLSVIKKYNLDGAPSSDLSKVNPQATGIPEPPPEVSASPSPAAPAREPAAAAQSPVDPNPNAKTQAVDEGPSLIDNPIDTEWPPKEK